MPWHTRVVAELPWQWLCALQQAPAMRLENEILNQKVIFGQHFFYLENYEIS